MGAMWLAYDAQSAERLDEREVDGGILLDGLGKAHLGEGWGQGSG